MNLRSVDLNLLTVLEALLDEAHVTRAAERLGMSQPAVSNALERCRKLFDDPLLVRGPGRMRLTARAEQLQQPLRKVLADVAGMVSLTPTGLAELQQTVRIVMPDFPADLIVSDLYQALQRTAPGLRLVIYPWTGSQDALDALARGQVEVVVAVVAAVGASLRKQALRDTRHAVVMRRHHPAAKHFDLEAFLAHPHVQVSGNGDSDGAVDQALARLGRSRRVGVVVPTFQMVPSLVAKSDLIAVLPARCVSEGNPDLVIFEPPLTVEMAPISLVWHSRHDKDAGVQHVIGILGDAIILRPTPKYVPQW